MHSPCLSFNRSAPGELIYSTQQSMPTGIHQSILEAQISTSSSPRQTQKPHTKCQIILVTLFIEIATVIFKVICAPKQTRRTFDKSRSISSKSDTNIPGYIMSSDFFFSTFCCGDYLSNITESERPPLTPP